MTTKTADKASVKQGTASLYDRDFHAWAQQQADLVRSGRFGEIDRDHLIEEIEDLGKSQAHSLQSAYRLIAMHLLKMTFQADKVTDGWRETIVRERANIGFILDDFPDLEPQRQRLFDRAYPQARNLAAKETGLPMKTFPAAPPFTLRQIEDEGFWA